MKNLSNYILEAKNKNLDIDRRQPKSRSELEMLISSAFKLDYHELNWDLSGLSSQLKTFRNYLAD